MAEQGQLDLGHALPAAGVLGEDVEDHRHPVDDVAAEDLLEVALLHRAQLAVDDHHVDVQLAAEAASSAALPLPM